jgi:hypothetical protein
MVFYIEGQQRVNWNELPGVCLRLWLIFTKAGAHTGPSLGIYELLVYTQTSSILNVSLKPLYFLKIHNCIEVIAIRISKNIQNALLFSSPGIPLTLRPNCRLKLLVNLFLQL